MHYLITYDICNDKKRNRVAKILTDYGSRVQKSVFELADLRDDVWNECLRRLKTEIDLKGEDSIRIYSFCKTCSGKIKELGAGRKPMEVPEVYII